MKELKIKLKFYPNEHMVTLHTNEILKDKVEELEVIKGIERVDWHSWFKYLLSVSKGEAFDWNDIIPLIKAKLSESYKLTELPAEQGILVGEDYSLVKNYKY